VNLLKIVVGGFLVVLPSLVMADTGKFCTYLMNFGFRYSDTKAKQDVYSLRNCKDGDVVMIHITDSDKLNREQMYMAGEIAEICDNNRPITIVSKDRAVCTYRGSRRNMRRSE